MAYFTLSSKVQKAVETDFKTTFDYLELLPCVPLTSMGQNPPRPVKT